MYHRNAADFKSVQSNGVKKFLETFERHNNHINCQIRHFSLSNIFKVAE